MSSYIERNKVMSHLAQKLIYMDIFNQLEYYQLYCISRVSQDSDAGVIEGSC